jgi:hypothetical protein
MVEGSLTLPPLIRCADEDVGIVIQREIKYLRQATCPSPASLYKPLPKQSLLRRMLKDAYRDFQRWLPWAYYLQKMSAVSELEVKMSPTDSALLPESGVIARGRTILQTLKEINHDSRILGLLRQSRALREEMRVHRIRTPVDRAWINRMQRMSGIDAYRTEAHYELFREVSSRGGLHPDTPSGHALFERLVERIVAANLTHGLKPKEVVCCEHTGPLRGVCDGGIQADTVPIARLYESYPAVRSSSTAPRVLKFGVRVCGRRYGVIAPAFLLRKAWPEAYKAAIRSKVKCWVQASSHDRKGEKAHGGCKRKRRLL